MKNSKMKKSLSLILSLIMILSALPLTALSSFALTTSGDWEYSVNNNEATITKYKGTISEVTIPSEIDGYIIASIGENAFYKCTSLTSVTIPNSVTSIGRFAFDDCTSLTSVTIPDSVTSIGEGAFYVCTSLTSITIPSSVMSIVDGAFSGCTSLQSINVDSNNPSYCSVNGVLFNKDKSELIQYPAGKTDKQYSIPNSVTSIGRSDFLPGAFQGCTSLNNTIIYYNPNCNYTEIKGSITEVIIPDSVTSIGYSAFEYCTSLKSITIPNSVTSINRGAFYGCTSLTSVTIADSVTSIGEYAFSECTSLASITIPDGVTIIGDHTFSDCTSLTSVTIPNSVTSIDWQAFSGCTSLESITIPDSVTSIGDMAFFGCTSLAGINVDSDNPSYCSVNGVLFNKDKSELIQYPAKKTDKEYIIPDSVTSIGEGAFAGCTSLTSVTIPDSVTSISSYAFAGCTSLTSVTIRNSVTNIGWYAFYKCTSLTGVTIPNSVTSIGSYAFSGCTSLTGVTIPDNVISIGNYAFRNCTSLTGINVDSNNQKYCSVNGVLFNKDKSILIQYPAGKTDKEYIIPDSVLNIEHYAFMGCTSLKSIIIPNNFTSIVDFAFYGCTSLTSITIPDSVTSIGNHAFDGCTSLTSITIPDSVTSIGNSVFEDCTSLTSVTIPNSVTSIGTDAFRNCTSLTSVTIPNSITSICNSAFYNCTSLTSVIIPSNVTSIGYHAIGYNKVGESEKIDNLVIYGYKGSAAETYAKENEIKFVDLNHEHTWGTVTYKWSSDNKTCTATRTCLEDSSHVETETATATSKVTKEPTTTSTGTAVYTATFKNTVFKTQTKNVTLDKLPDDDNKGYPDVKEGAWYFDAAQYCADKGYISGYANGNFGPNDSLKRQDFVCILARIDGADLKNYENVKSKLTDVKNGDYYAAAVNWAVDKGYISGYKNGKFGVNDPITREQVATILYNYMNKPNVKDVDKILAKFPDANKVSSFAKTPVAWAVSNGIISGMGNGTVASTSGATRAQIAAIIERMDKQGMFNN